VEALVWWETRVAVGAHVWHESSHWSQSRGVTKQEWFESQNKNDLSHKTRMICTNLSDEHSVHRLSRRSSEDHGIASLRGSWHRLSPRIMASPLERRAFTPPSKTPLRIAPNHCLSCFEHLSFTKSFMKGFMYQRLNARLYEGPQTNPWACLLKCHWQIWPFLVAGCTLLTTNKEKIWQSCVGADYDLKTARLVLTWRQQGLLQGIPRYNTELLPPIPTYNEVYPSIPLITVIIE